MKSPLPRAAAALAALCVCVCPCSATQMDVTTKSGILSWIDVDTPKAKYQTKSSRGATWDLVFSDEFNVPGRDFAAGNDYLWTALEMPDGVNSALEYYSVNMTSTQTDAAGRGFFQIEVRPERNITFTVFNAYAKPPAFEDHYMYYRSGMVQSWNKFCFQGGLMEVVAQMPGAVSAKSGNPDLGAETQRVQNIEYYPTWPGIWLMGNLGRALFTASTNRMWPWTFDECVASLKKDQAISACDGNPGHGLNKHQGRGAPEIDLLEGGGTDVSTSVQIAPGMPEQFRVFPPHMPPPSPAPNGNDNEYCMYGGHCQTLGANYPGVPASAYNQRPYKSWYQNLRYASNTMCAPNGKGVQSYATVAANVKAGIVGNNCSEVSACPGSHDGYSDLSAIDGTKRHWGVNAEGGCMPVINGYMGSYLCDPDNTNPKCSAPLVEGNPKANVMDSFNYQMDAISANSGLPLKAYTNWVTYQLEWVMGHEGYIRWMIEGLPIFEIPADSIENVPQDGDKTNPRKIMIEEPMYIIFNVALSTSWGAKPPNPGKPCRGDGTDAKTNAICNDFPLYLKIDYIRLYQDTKTMSIGCDPSTHPTKQWIDDNLEHYEDPKNKVIAVSGGANCKTDDDCTVSSTIALSSIITGKCNNGKCECTQSTWLGPRCITASRDGTSTNASKGFGPSLALALVLGIFGLLVLAFAIYKIIRGRQRRMAAAQEAAIKASENASRSPAGQDMADLAEAQSAADSGKMV